MHPTSYSCSGASLRGAPKGRRGNLPRKKPDCFASGSQGRGLHGMEAPIRQYVKMKPIQKFIEFFLKRKWLGILVLAVFFSAVGVSTVYRGSLSHKQRTDLTVYLKAAEMIQIGRANHLYGIETSRHWHYVYTPLLAILLVPFVQFPLVFNVLLSYLFSVGALLGVLILSRSFSEKSTEAPWQIALSGIFCLPLFLNTFSRGQLGIGMLFLAVLVFLFYLKNRKLLAGVVLGFAISIKISPLALALLFFFFKKEWKVLIGAMLSLLLFIFIFPSMVLGMQQNWILLKTWHGLMSKGSLDQAYKNYLWSELFTPFAGDNQSLYAVITRIFCPSEAAFIGKSNAFLRSCTSVTGVLLLLALFIKRLPSKPVREQARTSLFTEYSLFLTLMLFISPVSQIHHYTTLFLLFLATLFLIEKEPCESSRRIWLTWGLWIGAFSILLGYLSDFFSYYGGPLWGSLFLWGVVFCCLKSKS